MANYPWDAPDPGQEGYAKSPDDETFRRVVLTASMAAPNWSAHVLLTPDVKGTVASACRSAFRSCEIPAKLVGRASLFQRDKSCTVAAEIPECFTFPRRYLAEVYANAHAGMAAAAEFAETHGITNGAAWYPVHGGMQVGIYSTSAYRGDGAGSL